MPVQGKVQFLNIDLLVVGHFDRDPLLAAAGDRLFVLHEDAVFQGKRCVVLEVAAPALDLPRTLARLVKWVAGLPPAARRSWAAASWRVFDIGIQAGAEPYATHWTIRQDQVAALAKVGGEIVLTIYGAQEVEPVAGPRPMRSPSRRGDRPPPGRAGRPPRRAPRGAANRR